jgi:uncharacterized protein YlxW (UPF0749 family)
MFGQVTQPVLPEGGNASSWIVAILTSGTIGAIALKVVDAWLKKKQTEQEEQAKEVADLRKELTEERAMTASLGIRLGVAEVKLEAFAEMKNFVDSMRMENERLSRLLLRAGIDPLTGEPFHDNRADEGNSSSV